MGNAATAEEIVTRHVVVLGAGRIGAAIAADLACEPGMRVTTIDADETALRRVGGGDTLAVDVCDTDALRRAIADADLVVGALPSFLGFRTLRAVIEAGRNCCDISFMAEDARQLDGLAREHGVTAVFDCGVAPGLSNIIVGDACRELNQVTSVKIYVGGLPEQRHWPFQYKAGFSPYDVIQEYTRPVRMVEHGTQVRKPALSDPELIDFPRIGTLEAFNTDGLRSLLTSVDAPLLVEKTLRYPGHRELITVLREIGMFDLEPVAVGTARTEVRPIDVTAALLFPKWRFGPDEADLTLMRIEVASATDRYRCELFDRRDQKSGWTSMARTTGFSCTAVVGLLTDGAFNEPGVHAPEEIGRDPTRVARILEHLRTRGIEITLN